VRSQILLIATISFVTFAHPFVCPHGTFRLPLDRFSWNLIWVFFRETNFEIIQISLKNYKNNGYLTRRPMYIFQTKAVEKIKTRVLCSVTSPPPPKSCRLWDNVGKILLQPGQGTDGNIIRPIRIACWITKATNTHSEYVILIAFILQQCFFPRTRLGITLCVHCLSFLMQTLVIYLLNIRGLEL